MPTGISFSEVVLCTYDNDITKPWFVYFDVTDHSTGITLRKQFRSGINYASDLKERLVLGDELKKFWQEQLKQGWSPFLFSSVGNLSKMRFNDALDWALTKCETASKTKLCYACTVRFFKEAAKKLNLHNAFVSTIKRRHIRLMLDHIKEVRKWSNHSYNKNTTYICGVLSRLVEYDIIDHNPAHNIKRLPVAETDFYEPLTEGEKIIIRDRLTKIHPSFFTYLMLIYHCGVRPKECLALRISDVHLNKNLIIIKPNIEEENSKTKSIRMVPLNKFISDLLRQHIEGYNNNFFLFGSPNGPVGKRGRNKKSITGSIKTDYFLPSLFHMKRDTATKLWHKYIIKGLKINKKQYCMKHTGGDDKIMAGIPLDALREMYGHSSKFMTEKYAKKIKGIYRQQIIVNSPEF